MEQQEEQPQRRIRVGRPNQTTYVNNYPKRITFIVTEEQKAKANSLELTSAWFRSVLDLMK